MVMAQLARLKVDLKTWEHDFISENNRPPTKDDIKHDAKIKSMYKKYSYLKKSQPHPSLIRQKSPMKNTMNKTPQKHDNTTKNNSQTPVAARTAMNGTTKAVPSTGKNKTTTVQLGPTPQIYGESISILDIQVSPLKPKKLQLMASDSDQTDVSPASTNTDINFTPIQELPQNDDPSLEISPMKPKRLQLDSLRADHANTNSVMDSIPKLFSQEQKNVENRKNKLGPNSPLKLINEIKITKQMTPISKFHYHNLKSPSSELNFESPSPLIKNLKFKNKSLKELHLEYHTILREFKLEKEANANTNVGEGGNDELISSATIKDVFNDDQEQEQQRVDEEEQPQGKQVYGKPGKRKRILRRLQDNDEAISAVTGAIHEQKIIPKNIHKELLKLKREQVSQFFGDDVATTIGNIEDMTDTEENEELDSHATEPEKPINKPKRKKQKKYNLVSNNFRRLKLPKKNRRWPGRRR
ncbi:Sld2p NDAI_0K01530 [Naumovozyma dairenensis CBS 421]|uniref:DNA replication regulator SLD2 n=1 Tax=Naumovozyma dairenensis (strain ATCC 10597 / BCRC 20456 / CBS 421 / NBRC 0211 / NRRL Y-12639) TaxID=1071378 RepID=G0WHT3_NAUDC|nr:hypothetical protein NDAI_0K01530 [Naumovozyma dairenensis CBS 421]CCD27344.1 hypothetical protein NDAI_0K01530 [Naumovozyma dairenensis CBS 421]